MSYTEQDRARLHPEPAKGGALSGAREDTRSPFARDRARVLHSAALRRLAGKTQVVGPGEGAEVSGVPRTRLTHSLEVAQIGRGIAEDLGADPDIVDTAGLAHDIGHPPFGHNGEHALNEAAEPCGGFEGNAQTLRILTRLEPKILGGDPDVAPGLADTVTGGLNLTRASLDAATKYPWPRRPGTAKFGVYADDLAVFRWLRGGGGGDGGGDGVRTHGNTGSDPTNRDPTNRDPTGSDGGTGDEAGPHGGRRCLEAQIMDWADDVAYSVHDVEDAVRAGRISFGMLADPVERAAVAALAAKHFTAEPVSAVEDAAAELLTLPVVAELAARGYDSTLGAQVTLKRLTSELVGRFASAAVTATREEYGHRPLWRYEADLRVPARVAAEVALLKAMALRYVMSDRRRLALQEGQRQLLAELIDVLLARSPEALEPVFRQMWSGAESDAERLRVVIDQVATLTDAQAHAWHSWHTGRHA
ncbi:MULTISPECIES: deoxyguanosinetriphosphate triphosphohydrolase family protein [Prauserella salsuginis group]|uniref:Deoxyguanosinetriphosphate triphosphohydrolase-like protein n=1 Tax=Prauserella salsuginis TaxID=387889 RepID=A0ABW6G3Q0_9PSEU|nr:MULTISPECIES: deoxyguanosinetriphosphate triphosphohydrolase family protein [Prauserella salsuginis group]MCR3718683.1 dGTPase [Prauserella flava]MCR3733253.1 dGTPase [Prauserella salsuginis]